MNQREKLLGVGVALLAILWAATMGVDGFRKARERNYRDLKNARMELNLAREASERGLLAQNKLREWGRQSLPTDIDIAKSLYEDWLREQLTESGLYVSEINDQEPGGAKKRFQEVTFKIEAQGKLGELSDFLYRFYRAGQLHRISQANLKPTKSRDSISISLTINALSLDNCKRKDTLADRPSDQPLPPLEEIRQIIVDRNIFAVYSPPVPDSPSPGEQPTDSPDTEAAQARFTGMTYGKDGWQMAVHMTESGKVLFFREGDSIEIGRFVGQISKLEDRRAIVTLSNQRVMLTIGQYLTEAQPLADQAG